MSDNLSQFMLELDRATKDMTEGEVLRVHRRLHLEALASVVKKTPVDTGVTRGNWQSTIGAPATGQLPLRTEQQVLAEGVTATRDLEPFSTSFITNNVDHILVLEEGGFVPPNPGPSKDPRPGRRGRELVRGGFSVQAPQGMVAITVEELQPQRLES